MDNIMYFAYMSAEIINTLKMQYTCLLERLVADCTVISHSTYSPSR